MVTLNNPEHPIFDYRTLRLAMGVIALSLPLLVAFIANQRLESVSASYYTNARDVFVGLMFVVAAFLFAYNGWTLAQACASKLAALGAMLLALFPTACKVCEPSANSTVHQIGAALLFSILAYFLLGPFRQKTKGQGGKKALRANIYLVCGWLIILSMLAIIALPDTIKHDYRVVFWAEAVALFAFGAAWIVAGKTLSPLVSPDEKLVLFSKKA